ncbi:MAG: TRAP transporter substrate-binding protein DctP [Victivallales bacterium]|nr:TRAP transporter substrate-binding protein DctP [Victivallales bacterium]
MRKIFFYAWLAIFCLMLSASQPEFRLTYSVFFPATHVHSQLALEWANEIYRRTDGRVKIDVSPGCVLSSAGENYECVVQGVTDLGMSCFSYSRGMFPMMEGLDLPLGYQDGRQATRIANAYFRKFRPKELEDVQVMYIHAHGPGVLAVKGQVTKVSELKGKSIRGTGVSAMVIRALEGNAIGMGQPDTYEALRKGVVEGTLCPIETLKGWRQGEVIDSVVKIPSAGYTTAMFVVMNQDTWRRLPPDIQQIIRQVNEEWIPKHGQAWDAADAEGEAFVLSLGKTISTLEPTEDAIAQEKIAPVLEEWAAAVNAKGLPGSEALAFLKEQVAITDEALAPPLPTAVDPEFRLTYSVFFPATHVHSQLAQQWADEVYERTGGRVKVEVYPGCVLSAAGENYECVVQGVTDLGMSCFSYSRGMFPMIEGLDLPLGYRDGRQATRIANAYFRKFQPEELKDVKVMYIHAHGPGVLAVKGQVTKVSELKGKSIRGTGVSALVIRALEGNAIGMGQPDTYEALRKGVVEGTLCPIETLKGWRQGEVIDSVVKIPSGGYTTAMFVVMNLDVWRKLPLDIRNIIMQINEEWIPRHGLAWDEADEAGEAFVRGLGKRVETLLPEEDAIAREKIAPVLEEWAKGVDNRGLPGTEALEFLKAQIAQEGEIPLPELPPETDDGTSMSNPYHFPTLLCLLTAVVVAGVFTMRGGSAQASFWENYRKVAAFLCIGLAGVSGVALLALLALTLADIVGRQIGCPIRGAVDVVQLLACLCASSALPYVTAVKGHIAVEFFFQRFPKRTRIFWDTINRLLVITLFMYLSWSCFQHGARLFATHAVGLSLNVPIFWVLYVMGFSFCLAILVVIYNLTHPGREMIRP